MIGEEQLKQFAANYIWWKTPEEAIRFPNLVIARVMDVGTLDDVFTLTALVCEDELRERLRHAEPGQFRPQSWSYWHYRLDMASSDKDLPAMPKRTFPEGHRVSAPSEDAA